MSMDLKKYLDTIPAGKGVDPMVVKVSLYIEHGMFYI